MYDARHDLYQPRPERIRVLLVGVIVLGCRHLMRVLGALRLYVATKYAGGLFLQWCHASRSPLERHLSQVKALSYLYSSTFNCRQPQDLLWTCYVLKALCVSMMPKVFDIMVPMV